MNNRIKILVVGLGVLTCCVQMQALFKGVDRTVVSATAEPIKQPELVLCPAPPNVPKAKSERLEVQKQEVTKKGKTKHESRKRAKKSADYN